MVGENDPGSGVGGNGVIEPSDITVDDPALATDSGRWPRATTPERIGRFRVLRRLGVGGMGAVFAAYDEALDRRVAVKLLLHNVDEASRQRVEHEAQAMARLTHPNVVQVYEVGEHQGEVFIAMELVDGQTLKRWQRSEDRTWQEIVEVYRQAGEGLAAAHEAGLVHRDFKPSNAMVTTTASGDVRVKVLDFGVALLNEPPTMSRELVTDEHTGRNVGTGRQRRSSARRLMGTPKYMAPEQFAHDDVGPAADQFSLSTSMWEALFGVLPYRGSSASELYLAILQGRMRPLPSKSKVPRWVRNAIVRGLSAAPRARWPSIRALLDALDPSPGWRSRVGLLVAPTLAGAAAATVAWGPWRTAGEERCDTGAAQLETTWGEASRVRVREAFSSSEASYATAAYADVEAALDDYGAAWISAHTEACLATTVRREQPLEVMAMRLECLQDAKVHLGVAVEVLANADADIMSRSRSVLESLPDLHRCSDLEALQQDAAGPAAGHAAAVDEAREQLAGAKVEYAAGRYDTARSRVALAKERLGDVDHPPLQIELMDIEGRILMSLGQDAAAEEVLLRALRMATETEDLEAMQELSTSLLIIVGSRQGRAEEALGRFRMLAEGLAHDDDARVRAQEALSRVFRDDGKHAEAEAALLRALALASRDERIASLRAQLGGVLLLQGKNEQGKRELKEGLALREASYGADHPFVAEARSHLAIALHQLGDHERAEAEIRRALGSLIQSLGSEHPFIAKTRLNLAVFLSDRGKFDESEREYRRARELIRRAHGPKHFTLVSATYNLAAAVQHQGREGEAETLFREAVELAREALSANHPKRGLAHLHLGQQLLRTGRVPEALEHAEAAWAILQRHDLRPDHRAAAAAGLAEALWRSPPTPDGDARARALTERAAEKFADGGRSADAARTRAWLVEPPGR